MRQVVVTGIGAITPLGLGARLSWSRLLEGKCGIVSTDRKGEAFNKLPSRVAGIVPEGAGKDRGWTASEWLPRDEERRMAKFAQYGVATANEALRDAGWYPQSSRDQENTGVCLGSGIGAFDDVYDTSVAFERGGQKKVSPLFVPRLLVNLGAGHISMKYGLKGPNHSATTACTTGAHSIADAARFILAGDASVMLAGASESCIHPLALAGFSRSHSLISTPHSHAHPHLSSRPFSASRSGFVIAEGAAVLVLEELEHALRRRAPRIYARLAGYGASADAWHMTQPHPHGDGAARSMRRALATAGKRPADVDYVNAHATSTVLGDRAEAEAIRTVFCDDGEKEESEVCVSSTKGATGHLLGAAGALEAMFTVLAVAEDVVPPTLNLGVREEEGEEKEGKGVEGKTGRQRTRREDPELPGFDYVAADGKAQKRRVDVALTNSFGFGGTNATLCFEKYR